LKEKVAAPVYKTEITAEGFVTLTTWHSLLKKLALTLLTSSSRSVGIVRLQIQATEFIF
jgi:hypothetical protein